MNENLWGLLENFRDDIAVRTLENTEKNVERIKAGEPVEKESYEDIVGFFIDITEKELARIANEMFPIS